MWRWLLVKLPKRTRVLGTLWFISGSAHALILLSALVCATTGSRQALVVTSARRQTDAHIVLLPLYKTVRNTKFDKPVHVAQQTSNPLSTSASVQAKAAPKKVTKSVNKKVNKTTLATTKKTSSKPKPPVAKKKEPLTQKTQQKKEHKPVVAKADLKPENQKITQKKTSSTSKEPVGKVLAGDTQTTQEVIYVGRDDLRAMQTQHVVYNALQKHWRPPSGIAQDTVCHIVFEVDKEGNACNVVMQQNSNVLIFDIAARTAILQSHFSSAAQGQKFTVAFKP